MAQNIMTHPNGKTFIVYGTIYDPQSPIAELGAIVVLDFSSFANTICMASDYEQWNSSSDCLLGKIETFKRRKRTSSCFVSYDISNPINKLLCPCKETDYECDFGYVFNTTQEKCIRDTQVPAPKYPPDDCPSGSYFNQTRGYRLIAGDVCDLKASGAVNYLPAQIACPGFGGARPGLIALGIIIVLVVIGVGAFVYYKWFRKAKNNLIINPYAKNLPDTVDSDEELEKDLEKDAEVLEETDISSEVSSDQKSKLVFESLKDAAKPEKSQTEFIQMVPQGHKIEETDDFDPRKN